MALLLWNMRTAQIHTARTLDPTHLGSKEIFGSLSILVSDTILNSASTPEDIAYAVASFKEILDKAIYHKLKCIDVCGEAQEPIRQLIAEGALDMAKVLGHLDENQKP